MTRLSHVLIAGAGIIMAQAAVAADLPVKAPRLPLAVRAYNWSGFYLGGHVGYLWGRTRVEDAGVVAEPHAPTNGVMGGVLAGYNWQFDRAVVGIEGDIGFTRARGTGEEFPPPPPPPPPPNIYDVHWTGHARARAGYAFDNWLLYVAGGLAVADFKFLEGGPPAGTGARYTGWTVGGGVETALMRNLLARLEYLYDDFGSKNYTGIAGDPYRVTLTGQTVRGALVWKFD